MIKQIKNILDKHGIKANKELLKELSNQHDHAAIELNEKYKLLFNNSHLAYQSLDINGNILETNPTWLKTLGYEKNDVIGKWFGNFLHPDYIDQFKNRFERFKEEGTLEDVRFRMKQKTGGFILVSFKGCIIYNPNGEFKCTYCSFKDITEEENILVKLKENEERYVTAQKMGNVGNWEYNVQTGNFWGSDQAKRIYGFDPTKDEFTADEVENCILERNRVHQALIDLIEKEKEYNLEFEIYPKNSKNIRIISSFAQLHLDEKGDALKVVGVIQDITERKKADLALKESEEKYRKLTENSPEITYINNLNKGALYWSSKIKDVLGFDPNNIVEETTQWTKSLYKEDIPKINEILNKIEVGKSYELEYRIYDVNNNLHWFYDRVFNVYKKNGDIILEGIISDITEEKRIEKELKESEEKYRKLVENQGEGIAIANKNEIFTFSNPTANKIFGIKKGTLVGKSLNDFLLPSEQKNIKKETVKRKKGDKSTYELQIIRQDGETRIIQVTVVPDFDQNGNFASSFGIFRDITIEKKTENLLKENEEKFRAITNSAQDAIILIDDKGEVVFWNKAATKILQYKKEEIFGKNFHSIIVPSKYMESHSNAFKSFIKTGKGTAINQVLELSAIRKDKVEIPVELSLSALKLQDKWHAIGILRDISERIENQKSLIESEQRFKNLSGLTFEGIVFHKNGIAFDCNESFLKLFNYKREEIINSSLLVLIHPDDHKKTEENVGKEFAEPYEVTGIKKDKTTFPIEIEARNVNLNNEIIRVVAIRDITERKKAEEQLKEHNRQLNELNATKDKFFSIIAHDLRGPMNNLVGFSDLLEHNHLKYEKEKLSHIINLMSTTAKRTFSLLENLLIWSRSQRDKINFNPQTFICKELVSEVLQDMEHLAFAKGISFETDKENKGHPVFVDKDMFKTVYRNLISNAIKYTKEGGTISLGCGKVTDGFVEFFVKDDGVGIPKETIEKLFKIDENVTTEGTNQEHGTGLGLILCKDFIDKHGGKIWVESEENNLPAGRQGGSTFWFTFPIPEQK